MRRLRARFALAVLAIMVAGCASLPPEEAVVINNKSLWEQDVMPSKGLEQKAVGLTSKSTLHDYLLYAALNNPGLKAAFLKWKAALEKIPQVTALPDPRFTYGYFIQIMMNQHQSFALEQTFPWFGKLKLQGDAAAEAARAEKARYDAAKLKLFYEVKEAYYEYYYLAQAIAVTKENLGYVKYLESVARTGYASGMIDYADVVRAQVELGKLEDSLKTLDDGAEPVAARLNAALNRPPDAPLFWPEKIKEEKAAFTSKQLLEWLKEYNPELKALGFEAAGAKWQIARARKDYYPDLTLGMQGVDMIQGKDAIVAMATVNLPVWRSKYRAEVREAAANYESLLGQRSDRRNTLGADVKLAEYKYRDAERKIALYRGALIPEAKQAIDVSLQAYQTGKEGYTAVVDAIRNLLEFELSYERAITDREQRLAELEMLVGRAVTVGGRGD
ncbi:MAG: TolC family protein [Syntrophobacteraceae bacterium]|nr:TolC family protein [Syntrophobacteraceae bacterium]